MFLLRYWIHCISIDNNHSITLIRHLCVTVICKIPRSLMCVSIFWVNYQLILCHSYSVNAFHLTVTQNMYAVWSFAIPLLVAVPLSLSNDRVSNPFDIILKSLLWQSSVLFLWSWDKRWVDSHEVNGALRKCYVPLAQDKVLFFWWESCHFIRYNSFLCQSWDMSLCEMIYSFSLACLLNLGQKITLMADANCSLLVCV